MYIITLKLNKKILMVSIFVLTIFVSIVCFAGSFKKEVKVPVIMYHQILKDKAMHGKYVVSPDDFEKDLLYLKEKGFTTVTIKDLVDFVYYNKELPEKPVVLSFDDGHLSNYHYIFPIIKKYNAKIVISVVGEYCDNATSTDDRNVSYSYLRWEDVKELSSSGLVEIANHTFDFHKQGKRVGIGSVKEETKEQYENLVGKDLHKLNAKIKDVTGVNPVTFTYPFGKAVNMSFELIKKLGFKASLSCEEGINYISFNAPDSLYMIKRYNRPSGISAKDFFCKLKLTDL